MKIVLPTISECTFYPLRPSPKGLIGIASCLFDGRLRLDCVSVYSTPAGDIRLLFPDKTLPNGKKINVYFPVDRATYDAIRLGVLEKINTVKENVKGF